MAESNPHGDPATPSRPTDARGATDLVTWALVAWGGLLAAGAGLIQPSVSGNGFVWNVRPVRGALVLACVGMFVGVWRLLLRSRLNQLRDARGSGVARGDAPHGAPDDNETPAA